MILDDTGKRTQCDRCGKIFNDRTKRVTLKAHMLLPEHDSTNTYKTRGLFCRHLCPDCSEWLQKELNV